MMNFQDLDHLGIADLAPFIGQRCILTGRSAKPIIGRIIGIDNSMLPVHLKMDNGGFINSPYRCACSEVKVLLKPLSGLTAEDETECIRFLNMNQRFGAVPDPAITNMRLGAIKAKWYLANGFDIFGFIGAGLALDIHTALSQEYYNKIQL